MALASMIITQNFSVNQTKLPMQQVVHAQFNDIFDLIMNKQTTQFHAILLHINQTKPMTRLTFDFI